MKEFVNLAEQSLKSFFKDKINIVILLLILTLIVQGGIFYFDNYVFLETMNKIGSTYHNERRTTEMLNNVEIGAYGILQGKLTEEQQIKKDKYKEELEIYRHKKQKWRDRFKK